MSLTVEHNGKQWEVDCQGYRLDCDVTPDEDWYDYLRIKEGMTEITSEHRRVLEHHQQYYKKNGIGPRIQIVSEDLKIPLRRIYEIFPRGFTTVRIMAGFPSPLGGVI